MDKNKTAFEAQREALQDANAHPERPFPTRPRCGSTSPGSGTPSRTRSRPPALTSRPQPVDEPAPLAYPRTT